MSTPGIDAFSKTPVYKLTVWFARAKRRQKRADREHRHDLGAGADPGAARKCMRCG